MITATPGGVSRLKRLIDEFHARNVKVLLPLKPWDLGSRRAGSYDKKSPTAEDSGHLPLMKALLEATGADGINGPVWRAL
jgi:hypothetical protein